jgi:hypothetical protein
MKDQMMDAIEDLEFNHDGTTEGEALCAGK